MGCGCSELLLKGRQSNRGSSACRQLLAPLVTPLERDIEGASTVTTIITGAVRTIPSL